MSDSQSDDGFTLVDGQSEGAFSGEGGLLSATQQQEDAASINKFLELNVFPCEHPPPQAPASLHQHLPLPPTSCHVASRDSSPDKVHAAPAPAADREPSRFSTPTQTTTPAPSPPSTHLTSQPASGVPQPAGPQSSARHNPLTCAHPATNTQDPTTASPGSSFLTAYLYPWPTLLLTVNLMLGFLAGINTSWCFWAMGGLIILHVVGLGSWFWFANKPHSTTARPVTSRLPTFCNEPSKDKVWMLSAYMVVSTLLVVIVFWIGYLGGVLLWYDMFAHPSIPAAARQTPSQASESFSTQPPPQPEKEPARWSHTTQQQGVQPEHAADAALSKYVEYLHQQLALKDRELEEQRHIINSIFNAQPPPTPNQRKLEVQIPRPAEPSSPEAEREAAEAAQQAQAREQCTQPPPPPPPERGADAPGACRPQPTPTPPAPAVSSNEPPKPSTQGPKLSKEYLGAASHPLSAGDQQQGAAGMHVQDPSEVAKAGEGHSSAALALQDLEQAEQARMGEWTRLRPSAHALAIRQRSSNLVASAVHKARGAAVALQRRGATAAHGTAEIAAAVRRAATASAVAVRQQGASLLRATKEKAAAAKQASHAAALQAWHAGSSTWLGKRAGACGLAVYNRAERFVERVAAAVHAARQVMRDTRSAVIAARRKMQAQAIEHVRTAYGRIEAAASDAKQRVVGLRLMGKAAQQQQPQQQQRAKQAQLQQEQAAKAAGRASDGGMLRSRLQQLVRRLPNLRRLRA